MYKWWAEVQTNILTDSTNWQSGVFNSFVMGLLIWKIKSNHICSIKLKTEWRQKQKLTPSEPLSKGRWRDVRGEEDNNRGSCGRMDEGKRSKGTPPHSPSLYHSSPCFLLLSVWHVQTAAIIQLLSFSSSHSLYVFLSSCSLLHSFIPLSISVFHPFTHSCLIYVISRFFSTFRPLRPPPVPPCANFSFLSMFVICDGPLPSFHCCWFPLHTALFSAAVQIQARTGHNSDLLHAKHDVITKQSVSQECVLLPVLVYVHQSVFTLTTTSNPDQMWAHR